MGKTAKYTNRVEYRDQAGWHTAVWRGPATNDLAEAWRQRMNKSMQPGGTNAHLIGDYVPHISHVKVINQRSKQVVATATMPMFEVV